MRKLISILLLYFVNLLAGLWTLFWIAVAVVTFSSGMFYEENMWKKLVILAVVVTSMFSVPRWNYAYWHKKRGIKTGIWKGATVVFFLPTIGLVLYYFYCF